MSHTPVGGHPQGWEHKLADRSSLPPASGEEKSKAHSKHVFTQPQLPKAAWREETEGSSGSSARTPSSGEAHHANPNANANAAPPYLRWARTLHDLLEDAEGVRQFRKFVSGAGGLHLDRLNFYFAVQGLRQEMDPQKIHQVVSAIYKFLRKSKLAMPEDLKQRVKQSIKEGLHIEKTIFDAMEREVTSAIMDTTYPAFLGSDAYVAYVSAATQPLYSPDASPPSAGKEMPVCGLATLHEGQELCGPVSAPPARLTHDALLATQSRRLHSDIAPGSFARKRSVYAVAPHLSYAGYCPASRQDSERASLSSGRADSDVVSLSGSSVDGMNARVRESREPRHRSRMHALDHRHVINKESDTAIVIPRTQRMQSEQLRVLPPSEFAPLLIEKLERVRRDQDAKAALERRLAEGDGEDMSQALPPQLVAAAIQKLQLDDDNDQDILDQHVSRVWSERTPGDSPPGGRRARARRRPPSTLSADSGHYSHSLPLTRRCFSKKAVTELTDSGVSVVSEGTSVSAGCGAGPASSVEPRILLWIAEGSERLGKRSYLSSRASSAERSHQHPLQQQHADERRRPQGAAPSSQRSRASGSKSSGTSGTSGASGEAAAAGAGATAAPCTVVVVTFLDENVPYRIKVPAVPLTLRTFKDYLPRKGNYRYFFKTECADLDNTVIQEEICNDSEILPMYEGKVMARVKSIE